MRDLRRAIVVVIMVAGGSAGLGSPASAARPFTSDVAGGAAFSVTGKTVYVFTEQPGYYTTYLVQTGKNGKEILYSAVVEAGTGDGSVPSSAEIQLRWTLCSHPATLTVVQRVIDGFDEFDEPIYRDATTFIDTKWTGGVFRDNEGNFVRPACGRDRK